ncbi:MAG: hypothetical protein QM611_11770 [Microbacterium sp.]|uniref:hypothetical protein n=1 Tax=Microbacterium sp. TaxID=51671 RepID=UPI0039E58A54
MTTRRALPLVIAAAALVALTGCSPAAPAPSTPSSTTPETPTPTPAETVPEATCENTLTADTLDNLAEAGWTFRQDEAPVVLGGVTIEGGIGCLWGDFSTGNDNVAWFLWGPLDDASAQAAIDGLLAEGTWRREDQPEGVYITDKAGSDSLLYDDEGYSTTYLFADGQVKGSTTKAGISVVTAPEGFAP